MLRTNTTMNPSLNSYQRWTTYFKHDLKDDVLAAIVVFLVAIPLCLGIALASGAPLFAGILSGIIGGVVVGALSGSAVSVSGPAAGMAAVVVVAILQLQDFNIFLLALSLAGLLQILLGSFRGAGFIADYIPANVVQGLLCAIGILLVVKQLPLAFTVSPDLETLKTHLLESASEQGLNLSPLSELVVHLNPGATLISLLSLGFLIWTDKTNRSWAKKIPSPIIVVAMGVLINAIFDHFGSWLAQEDPQLVNIPFSRPSDFLNQLQFPNFSAWSNPKVYLYAFMLALIASLESLLNIKAGEKLDKKRRSCSKDRELIAQGAGNFLAGLLGGIPVTSVIVRTSVNIQSGGKTKLATMLHGFFILLAILLFVNWLNEIPLCSLAAILMFTGYKLTRPAIYRSIYQQGWERFIPFIVTVFGIVFFNLLEGVLLGLAISLFYILKYNSQARLDIIQEVYPTGVTNRLMLPQQVTFLNKASLIAELASIPSDSQLTIDARYSAYIDKEVVELLQEFKDEQARLRNITVELLGLQDHYEIHSNINVINATSYDLRTTLAPQEVFRILQEGNQRFLTNMRIHRNSHIDIQSTAEAQRPIAIVLGCIDSRVPVETIFDMSFGDLFCVRVAGNVVNEDILASIEYACNVVGAKLIIILGHTRCGAIQAACDNVQGGHLPQLINKIKPAVESETTHAENRASSNKEFVNAVTELNIINSLKSIYQQSEILKNLIDNATIGMTGAVYDVSTGKVHFNDYSEKLRLDDDSRPLGIKVHALLSSDG